jgi:hypothetical protein
MATREEKNIFSNIILERAEKLNTDHLDAMVTYCEENDLEIDVAATLINEVLKCRLHQDAQQLRYIPKISTLPV